MYVHVCLRIHTASRQSPRCWPYRVECTGSLLTSEVKRLRARLVLGPGCLWTPSGVVSFFSLLFQHPVLVTQHAHTSIYIHIFMCSFAYLYVFIHVHGQFLQMVDVCSQMSLHIFIIHKHIYIYTGIPWSGALPKFGPFCQQNDKFDFNWDRQQHDYNHWFSSLPAPT